MSKFFFTLVILLIWPFTTLFACSLISFPVDRFKADTFVYSARVVNISTENDIFVNAEANTDAPEHEVGGLILDPIHVWNQPDTLNLHAVFMVKLLADCSYGFESIDVISGLYSIGDTVAVTARYLDSMLWGDATAHYPVLMVIPFENGSLANTRFLNPETGIDKSVLSFYSHIEELQSEFREIEEKARLSRTEPGRVTGNITVEDYDERLQQNRRSLGATRMRMNFELQRNLAKIHNSEVHDERIHYLTMLGHDWYAGWGRDSKVTRKKFDCGYTSLITHYFSYSSMTYELFHRFKENNGRSLPALDDCISEFNLPFTR